MLYSLFSFYQTILKISDNLFSRFENKWSFPQQQKVSTLVEKLSLMSLAHSLDKNECVRAKINFSAWEIKREEMSLRIC